eukprot:COSAG02_NODE_4391_length_5416_cov_14.139438_3_plen_623_part_00
MAEPAHLEAEISLLGAAATAGHNSSASAVLGTALLLAATAIYCRSAALGWGGGGGEDAGAATGPESAEGEATAGRGAKRKAQKQKPMKKGFFGKASPPSKGGHKAVEPLTVPEREELPVGPSVSANEIAAHKLMLRGEGLPTPRSEAEERLARTWKKAYWDRFAELMAESPPDLSQLVKTLRDLRSRIIGLTPSREDLRAQIVARIDLDLIEQMIDNEALQVSELSNLVQFMIERLRDLEAPAENPATDAWLQQMAAELATLPTTQLWTVLLPRAFVYVSDKIDTIGRDSAKSKEAFLAGYLSSHGADYERDNFAARGQVANVTAFATGWAVAQRSEGKQQLSVPDLVQEMLVGLVTSPTALPKVADKLPETLALDVRQLHSTQNQVQAIVLCCGWLHACTSVAATAPAATAGARKKGLEPQQLAALKATVLAELQNETPPTAEETERFKSPLDKIIATIEAHLKGALAYQNLEYGEKQQKMFRTLVRNMPDESNKVFALMKIRVTQALRQALAAVEEEDAAAAVPVPVAPLTMASGGTVLVPGSGAQERAPTNVAQKPQRDGTASARAKMWMTKNNLATVCTEVMQVAETLRPVMRHQVRVHGGLYAALLAPVQVTTSAGA